jgi:PKD repeat protein
MFTEGQKDRMRAAIISSVAQRNQLWTASNLAATGTDGDAILCAADFSTDRQVICVGETVQFSDESFNGVSSWTWDFGNGETLSGEDDAAQNPSTVYSEPGVYTVSLTAGNGVQTVSASKEAFITVLPTDVIATPLVDSFEGGIDDQRWFVTNPGNNVTWESTNSASITGSESIRIRNNQNTLDLDLDALISSTFDFSDKVLVTVKYKWAFAQRTTETDDRLKVSVSNDCGETWFLRKMHRGFTDLPTADPTNANFVPDAGEWAENTFTIDDPFYLVEGFRLRFEFEARGGNHVYLEDINIQAYTEADLSVINLLDETGFTLYPNPANDETRITFDLNQGGNADLRMTDAVGKLVKVIYSGNLPAGEQQMVVPVAELAPGMYFITLTLDGKVATKQLLVN